MMLILLTLSLLKELQDNMDGNAIFSILGKKLMTHGFSDNVIKEIVNDVQHIFTAEYLIENQCIVSLPLVRDTLKYLSIKVLGH